MADSLPTTSSGNPDAQIPAQPLECCDLPQPSRACDFSTAAHASQVEGLGRGGVPQAVDGDKSPAESGDRSPHSKG